MKKLTVLLVAIFLAISGVAFGLDPPKEEISKTMEVANPYLQFSDYCKVHNDTVYISLTSINSYQAEYLWSDFTLIRSEGFANVVIYLNNPGGDAFAGTCLTDQLRILRESGVLITMEAYGIVASAAIPVFMMAHKRIASKNTIFLIHPASLTKWGFFTETLKDLESQSKMIKMLRERYVNVIVDHSSLSAEAVTKMMGKDTWFGAEQAKEWGMVDELR